MATDYAGLSGKRQSFGHGFHVRRRSARRAPRTNSAFVLTRPFGATFGDVPTKSPDKCGIGFGTVGSSAVLAAILVGTILFTMRKAPVSEEPAIVEIK
jgi:hypothetical protein